MCAPAINYCFESAVAIALRFQLCSGFYTVLQTKTVEEVPSPRKYDVSRALTISYCLESVAAITLCFLAHYTALQMKNSVRIISAINPVTTENTDNSHLQTYCTEAMYHATVNQRLGLSAKRKWDRKEGKS